MFSQVYCIIKLKIVRKEKLNKNTFLSDNYIIYDIVKKRLYLYVVTNDNSCVLLAFLISSPWSTQTHN